MGGLCYAFMLSSKDEAVSTMLQNWLTEKPHWGGDERDEPWLSDGRYLTSN